MSNSADQDEPPPWVGSNPASNEVRTQANGALQLLQSQFEKLSSPNLDDRAELNDALTRFNLESLRALYVAEAQRSTS